GRRRFPDPHWIERRSACAFLADRHTCGRRFLSIFPESSGRKQPPVKNDKMNTFQQLPSWPVLPEAIWCNRHWLAVSPLTESSKVRPESIPFFVVGHASP